MWNWIICFVCSESIFLGLISTMPYGLMQWGWHQLDLCVTVHLFWAWHGLWGLEGFHVSMSAYKLYDSCIYCRTGHLSIAAPHSVYSSRSLGSLVGLHPAWTWHPPQEQRLSTSWARRKEKKRWMDATHFFVILHTWLDATMCFQRVIVYAS